jgi:hypothetical protein
MGLMIWNEMNNSELLLKIKLFMKFGFEQLFRKHLIVFIQIICYGKKICNCLEMFTLIVALKMLFGKIIIQ